jgi:hypothetical protein
LERTHFLTTRLRIGIESLQRTVASAGRVGRAGHEAMTGMWNELPKLLQAAHEVSSPRQSGATDATRNRRGVLKNLLHIKTYRLQLLQVLSGNDKERRSTVCMDFLGNVSDDENLTSKVIFSEEAAFHSSVKVNMHKSHLSPTRIQGLPSS